jgi:hypothetical protein
MIIVFRDELGAVAVEIDLTYGIQFGTENAYFTDTNGKDYKVNIEHLISITKAE